MGIPKLKGHDPWPTIVGGVLVAWNAAHWNQPNKHISRQAGKHPAITLLVAGWYLDHFLREWAREHVRSLVHGRNLRLTLNGDSSINGSAGRLSRGSGVVHLDLEGPG